MRQFKERSLEEVDEQARATGEFPSTVVGDGMIRHVYSASPVCFVLAANLIGERSVEPRPTTLQVIERDRECSQFTPWQQGFTPKEHKEMLIDIERRKLEDRQRRWDRAFDFFAAIAAAAFGAAIGYFLR